MGSMEGTFDGHIALETGLGNTTTRLVYAFCIPMNLKDFAKGLANGNETREGYEQVLEPSIAR